MTTQPFPTLPTATRSPRRHAAWLSLLPALVLPMALLLGLLTGMLAPTSAHAQGLNFKPLERGDVQEADQRMVVVRTGDGKEFGLEIGGDFALSFLNDRAKRLEALDDTTKMGEDFRLHINTWFHQDVSMHLMLQTTPEGQSDTNLRQTQADSGALSDAKPLTLTAREAYLQWNTNPNSHVLFGKQEISLGDRRGKVYDATQPAVQFDCRMGTWCMPFGAIKIGTGSADWIYNWALTYRAYDERKNNLRNTFEVEVYRILYTESNVPLGNNLGPTTYDPSNPLTAGKGQVTDNAGNPIYYDANEQNYGGLRINWLTGPIFFNFDFTSEQGNRQYHLYRDPKTGIVGLPQYATTGGLINHRETINGYTWETEAGARWDLAQLGLRYMTATGDNTKPTDDGQAYLRVLNGYHEITPGSYKGARLYFNGNDSDVESGGGFGHSVSNTTLIGAFLDIDAPDTAKVGYSAGLYSIRKNRDILNEDGKRRGNVGVEFDNMLTWHVHKALKLQFEVNALKAGGAFAIDDFTPPDRDQFVVLQGVARVVYKF